MLDKNIYTQSLSQQEAVMVSLRQACKKIAPLWSLENFVAVNPFLGLTDKSFNDIAQDLALKANIQMTLPSSFYLQKLEEGSLKHGHIASVLQKRQLNTSVKDFLEALNINERTAKRPPQISTATDVASRIVSKDWSRFVTTRISNWAASYFDHGQAIWAAANQKQSLFIAWKEEAKVDLNPEIAGLESFRKRVKLLPDNHLDAAAMALANLGITQEGRDIYLHTLLLRLGGWSAYAARLDWDSELYGGKDGKLIEFLAVLICWEYCLLNCITQPELKVEWKKEISILSNVNVKHEFNEELMQKLILQEAFDLAEQQSIINKFQGSELLTKNAQSQLKAQAIFCIDVRSEVFRRNLELIDAGVETLGFAGFFAFSIKYIPLGHESGEAQCPVLLQTGPTVMEEIADKDANQLALHSRTLQGHFQQVWKSFKSGAVTCFSFVSPLGLAYLPKLFTDSYGFTRPVPHPDRVGIKRDFYNKRQVSLTSANHKDETVGIPLEQQIKMAKNALNAMSLTENFAKLVLIVGHGSTMVNNPHATGYDCGACGGHTGESNAKVAAAVLNNQEVRVGLQKENIFIPINTIFLACLHDTTTDEVRIFNEHEIPLNRQDELKELQNSLILAGHNARAERSLRLSTNNQFTTDKAILARSKDWSETRPEWGLAGCSAFVVAPRERSRGIDFGGRSFLHSYDWRRDEGFGVLELIMTAPMVVTSWISLQYFGSTVDNKVFGSGNKTLHNVTAGLGVLEGFSGDLRVGLPWQAIYDGKNYQHEPVKLNVIIEAPLEAINAILEKHKSVRDLCDNAWLHLLAMDESGKVSHRYVGNFKWEEVEQIAA